MTERKATAYPPAVAAHARARELWDDAAAEMGDRLTPVRAPLLATYCLALAHAEEASEKLGQTSALVKGGRGGVQRNPLFAVVREQTELARKLADELGLGGDGAQGAQAVGNGNVATTPAGQGAQAHHGATAGHAGGPGAPGGPRHRGSHRPQAFPSQGGRNPVYSSPAENVLETQADYARRHGVTKPAVGKWKKDGRLVLQGALVDVRASDALLREAGLGRFKDQDEAVNQPDDGFTDAAVPVNHLPPQDADPDTIDGFLEGLLSGRIATLLESDRVKAAALAGIRALELRRANGSLVELEQAETVLFEQARVFRDAVLRWPDTAAPALANELQVPLAQVTETLTRLLHEFLADLGEPSADFSGEG